MEKSSETPFTQVVYSNADDSGWYATEFMWDGDAFLPGEPGRIDNDAASAIEAELLARENERYAS